MNKEKLQQLAHLIAGVLLIVQGFARFEQGDFLTAGGYLCIALLFVLFAGMHKKIVKRLTQGDVAIFLLEAILIFSVAYHYNETGHSFLFYVFAVVAAFYFVLASFSFRIDANPRRHSGKKRRKPRSGLESEFLKAGQSQRKV